MLAELLCGKGVGRFPLCLPCSSSLHAAVRASATALWRSCCRAVGCGTCASAAWCRRGRWRRGRWRGAAGSRSRCWTCRSAGGQAMGGRGEGWRENAVGRRSEWKFHRETGKRSLFVVVCGLLRQQPRLSGSALAQLGHAGRTKKKINCLALCFGTGGRSVLTRVTSRPPPMHQTDGRDGPPASTSLTHFQFTC